MSRAPRSIKLRLTLATAALVAACIGLSLGAVYALSVGASRRAIDRAVEAELDDLLAGYAEGGAARLESELARRMLGGDKDHGFLYLYSERSRILAGNMRHSEWLDEIEGLDTILLRSREMRLSRAPLDDGRHVVVGRDVTQSRAQARRFVTASLVVVVLAIVLAIGAGLALGHNLLGRVGELNRTIVTILHGERSARVEESGREDEFERLARHFNTLLDENEQLIAHLRGVTDDIAHALRTPLANQRRRIEDALAHPFGVEDCAEVFEEILLSTNGLLETFQALLNIAKIESGTAGESMTQVGLLELVQDAVELYEPVADEAGVALTAECAMNLEVLGNRHLLSQVLTNLIDNAIKFSPASAQVRVELRHGSSGVELSVSDDGPGIPPEDRVRVLQRFVRLESSRGLPGTGLGLSFVAAVAKMHKAGLILGDNQPGLVVTLRFPEER